MSILQTLKGLFTGNKAPMGPQPQPQVNPLTGKLLPSSQIQQAPRVQVPQPPRIQPTSTAVHAAQSAPVQATPATSVAKQLFDTISSYDKPSRTFTQNLIQAPKATIVDPIKGGLNLGFNLMTGLTNVLNTPRRVTTNLASTGIEKLTGKEIHRMQPLERMDLFVPKTKEEALGMSAGTAASYIIPGTGAARLTTGASLPVRVAAQIGADLGTDALAYGEVTPAGAGMSVLGALVEALIPGRAPSIKNLQVPTRAPISTPTEAFFAPRPITETSELTDFIVGPRKEIEALNKKAQELETRIQNRAKQSPFVPASKAGRESASKGAEGIIGRLRIESGFAAQQVGKAQRAGTITAEQADNLAFNLALKIPREQAQVMETFIDLFEPRLFDDVSLEISSKGGSQGLYEYSSNTVKLFRENVMNSGGNFDRGFIHEMWHGMSRYLPEDMTKKVLNDYLKEVQTYIKNDKLLQKLYNPKTQEITNTLNKKQYEELVKEMPEVKDRFTPVMKDGEIQYQRIIKPEEYRYTNVDEWFAENVTDASIKKIETMSQASKSVFAHAKAVFADMINAIVRVFGKDRAGKILDDFLANKYQDKVRQTSLKTSLRGSMDPSRLDDFKAKGLTEEDILETTPSNLNGTTLDDKVARALTNAGARIERLAKEIKPITEVDPVAEKSLAIGRIEPIQKTLKEDYESIVKKYSPDVLEKGKDYSRARAVLEKNKQGKATLEEVKRAKEILEDAKKDKDLAEIKTAAKEFQDRSAETYLRLKEAGLISEKKYIQDRTNYPEHVALFRQLTNEGERVAGVGSSKGVIGSGVKQAKGSNLEYEDILQNTLQARLMAENRILQNDVLRNVAKYSEVLTEADPKQNIVTVVSPKIIGTQFNEKTPIIDFKFSDPLHVPFVNEKGQTKLLKFSSKTEADFFKTLMQEGVKTNSDGLNLLLQAATRINQIAGMLWTKFDAMFPIIEYARTAQEAIMNMIALGKPVKQSIKQQIKPSKFGNKGVLDYVMGNDTEGARLYSQLVELGGASGGFSKQFKDTAKTMATELQSADPNIFKKGWDKFMKIVDDYSLMADGGVKLKIFKEGLDSGLTPKQAAAFAKRQGTLDYDIHGTFGPKLKIITMFANTSLKGLYRGAKIMGNPKALAVLTPALLSAGLAVREWNAFWDPDGEVQISDWDKMNSFPMVYPWGGGYFNSPVAHSFRPLKALTDTALDSIYGKDIDPIERTKLFLSSVKNNFSPSTGTVLDPLRYIATNKTFTGAKVRPGYEEGDYFESLAEDPLGRAFIKTTDTIDRLTNGAVNISPSSLNMIYESLGRPADYFRELLAIPGKEEGEPIKFPNALFKNTEGLTYRESSEVDRATLREAEFQTREITRDVKNLLREAEKAVKSKDQALQQSVAEKVRALPEKSKESFDEKWEEAYLNILIEKRNSLTDLTTPEALELKAEVDRLPEEVKDRLKKVYTISSLSKEEKALDNESTITRGQYILKKRRKAAGNPTKETEYQEMLNRLRTAGILTKDVEEYILTNI